MSAAAVQRNSSREKQRWCHSLGLILLDSLTICNNLSIAPFFWLRFFIMQASVLSVQNDGFLSFLAFALL